MTLQTLVQRMTLEEKASLMSGQNFWNTKAIERLNIPSIMLTDGPHGVRKQGGKADHLGLNASLPATCFPTAATLANSWDVKLLNEVGEYLGVEAAEKSVNVLLGPGLNIKRNPLCGRNFEYFSEDPYLSGKLAASIIRGIESQGISASAKHFAVNSQEHMRMSIDEVVDQRALHELYLEGFRIAITEGKPGTVMTSYNQVNGTFANEHDYLLNEVLFGQWGYEGVVVSDWGGNVNRVAALKAGCHLEMPASGGITDQEIIDAVQNGSLSEDLLDQRVAEYLSLVENYPLKEDAPEVDAQAHHEKAIDAARRSIVLLKNENDILPSADLTRYAVIGDFAFAPRYQGAGSSLINPTQVDSFKAVLESASETCIGFSRGFKRFGGEDNALKHEAVSLAEQSDGVLLFLGLDESSEAEGVDRAHMRLPQNQLALADALIRTGKPVIVVLAGGAPVELPFADEVAAIVHTYLAGQGGATALWQILNGEYSPSGKLAESYPFHYSDVASSSYYPGQEATSEHRESIYLGYRYFQKAKVPVRYPFGFGLSYSQFEYSDLLVVGLSVSCAITNIGDVAAEEVVQLYTHVADSGVFRAEQELKQFTKVLLQPGETKTVSFELSSRDFAYYHPTLAKWVNETGECEVRIGASSEDICLCKSIQLVGAPIPDYYDQEKLSAYINLKPEPITHEDFAALMETELPETRWNQSAPLTEHDTIAQGANKGLFARALVGIVKGYQRWLFWRGKHLDANNMNFVLNMRFSQLTGFSKGRFSRRSVQRLLWWLNLGLTNKTSTIKTK